MNPIINQMMGNLFANNPLVNLYRTIQSARNPEAALQSMAQTNPQLGEVLKMINQNGGNAEKLYYAKCQEKNIDPNIIINQVKNMRF